MNISTVLFRLMLWGVASVVLWVHFQGPTERALRDLTATVARLSGVRPVVAGSAELPPPGLRRDQIAIPFSTADGRHQLYGIDLMRWHANLIVLPPLALTIGRLTAGQRLLILLTGVPLLLVLDAAAAFLYLVLGALRMSGNPLLSATIHGNLEYAIAVVGVKIAPVAVWATLYVPVHTILPPAPGPHDDASTQPRS